MIHSGRFTALLDANTLYPAPIRDILLNLADFELYKPKWTDLIHKEWNRNLLNNRPDLKSVQLSKTVKLMNESFPDANIRGYKQLIDGLSLPDMDDRHILAAAMRGNADVIVTFNLKHFPARYLAAFDIEAQHPDQFIENLIHLDPVNSLRALQTQVNRLKNPPKTIVEVLDTLSNCGLRKSVALMHTIIDNLK